MAQSKPISVGGISSELLLANILLRKSLVETFEYTTVMLQILKQDKYELLLVAAKNEIAKPTPWVTAKKN
ncbi:hypothetical protein [uncultured Gilliamella sp.]|uniref:hypothetical protein n=1 Tax=uncultured Gilliamella sp. TaxID=1193505 RepID=UPI0025D30493|nr:hypothetical protein [uncultured Gilliamella sp.]